MTMPPPTPPPPETNVFWSAASLFDRMSRQLDDISLKLDGKADKEDMRQVWQRFDAHAADDRQQFDGLKGTVEGIRSDRAGELKAAGAVSHFRSKLWGGAISFAAFLSSIAIVLSVVHL
jgi:hypothetical protein